MKMSMKKGMTFGLAVVMAATLLTGCGGGTPAKKEEPAKSAATEISGTVKASGSTALLPLLKAGQEEFQKKNAKATVNIAGGGSFTGQNQVASGAVDIGNSDVALDPKLNDKGLVEHKLVGIPSACVGQGLATVMRQIVCETLKIDPEQVLMHEPDTDVTPDAGTTTASRQTLFTGEAVRQAALALAEALKTKPLTELAGQQFSGQYRGETDPLTSDKAHPVNHVAFGYATQVISLNDTGWLTKVVAAHDVGRAINPTTIEGQIEGAIAMGLGYALQEDFPLKRGVPTAKFGTLGLMRSTDMPEIEIKLIEKNPSALAYGAKGIGEIATIPTAPAVAGAYYRFDRIFRTQLPLSNTQYTV